MSTPFYQSSNSEPNYTTDIWLEPSFRHHFHRNIEIIYMLEGSAEVTANELSETLAAGEFGMILPDQIHSIAGGAGSRMWIGVFSEDYAREFYNCSV